jgi:HK97 family phage portal protein
MSFLDRIRSFVNRQTQSYWPNRASRIVYVQSTLAGIRVTPDTALQQNCVWGCVNILSKSVAMLPWRMMKEVSTKGEAGPKSLVVPGALDDLLNHRPNPEMSAFTFRQTMMGNALIWGNAFAEIERDGAGRPIALWPIEPDRVMIKRWWDTNRLYYMVNNQTKAITNIDFMDMFHIHGMSFDGITGYQTVGYAAQSIGLAMALERFGAAFFGNNGQLGGIIENSRSNLDAKGRESLLASFNAKHKGPDNAHRWEYLDSGMKATPIMVEPNKAQFVEAQQNQVEVICRWFGVPPHKVQHLLRSTNNNIEHQGIEFVTDGILPWTTIFEQEANFKLINQRNPQGYYSRIDVRSLQRGDLAARGGFYKDMFDRGVFSANDIRESEGMNPISTEEGGDKRFVPLNMQTLEDAGNPDPDDPEGAPTDPTGNDPNDPQPGESQITTGEGPSA